MTLYALDCEFMEDGKTIELLSLALVAEDGRELYIQNRNAQFHHANPWVKAHVLPQLDHRNCKLRVRGDAIGRGLAQCAKAHCPWLWKDQMADCIQGFVADDSAPRFLGYYCAYDWVALCQLYGTMMDLPTGWPMHCLDLRQWLDQCGRPDITQPDDMPHHALSDARWIMQTWEEAHGIVRPRQQGGSNGR